jgi:hypothetical protein
MASIYCEMVKHPATTTEEEYYCKALSNETMKINVTTSEPHRILIRQLQQEKSYIIHIRSEKKGPIG